MKYILTFMVLALCSSLALAQTDAKAKAILDKTVEHIKSYPAVERQKILMKHITGRHT